MLGYRPTTSEVIRKNSRGLFLFFSSYQENLQGLECMTSRFPLKALYENQETLIFFSVGVPELKIMGLPSTLGKFA